MLDLDQLSGLLGPRNRARRISDHELVRMDYVAGWRCKHCPDTFTHEQAENHEIPACRGQPWWTQGG